MEKIMEIGSMKGINVLSGSPMGGIRQTDPVSKNIREQIAELQRQMQELSSKEELPATEKVKKRQELQQEISSLNRELRQRQADNRKEQQKEALADVTKTRGIERTEVRDDPAQSDNVKNDRVQDSSEKNTGIPAESAEEKVSRNTDLQDIEIPQKEWKAIATSDSSMEQMRRQESVIARIEGGIAVLKGEIRLDEARGADVTKKQEELRKQEEKLRTANVPPVNAGAEADSTNGNLPQKQEPLFKDITVSFMS